MTVVTRRYRFASSHRLHSNKLSDADNCEVYGKCNNPYGHGHDYVLEVSVTGPVQASTGRVIPPAELDAYVDERVVRAFDHRDMNRDISAFGERVPTAENIAEVIREMLAAAWDNSFPGIRIAAVRVEETRRNSVEVRTL